MWVLLDGSRANPVRGHGCAFDYIVPGGGGGLFRVWQGLFLVWQGLGRPPRPALTWALWSWGMMSPLVGHLRCRYRSSRGALRRRTDLHFSLWVRTGRLRAKAPMCSGPGPYGLHRGLVKLLPTGGLGSYCFGPLNPSTLQIAGAAPLAATGVAGFLCLAEAHHTYRQGVQPRTNGTPFP